MGLLRWALLDVRRGCRLHRPREATAQGRLQLAVQSQARLLGLQHQEGRQVAFRQDASQFGGEGMTAAVEAIEVPEGHGLMCTLDKTGDVRQMWDRRNDDEVEAARKQFRELTRKGYLAYKAEGKDGHQGEQIREFDPEAERIILVKQLVGG
jgi:hypothetical protein